MNEPDRFDRLDQFDLAREALALAYERARATGYQPDSPQMLDLHLAEQRYRHAQRIREHAQPASDTVRGDSDDEKAEVGSVSRVIDLRESTAGTPTVQPRPAASS